MNNATATPFPPYLTVRQAADEIQVRPKTIYVWIKNQCLPACKLPGGTGIRIRRTDWETLLNDMSAGDDQRHAAHDRPAPLQEMCTVEDKEEDLAPPPFTSVRAPKGAKRDFFELGLHGPSKPRH